MTAPARSILDAWTDLVDRRTGVVREVTELRLDDDDPPFTHYLSAACDTGAFGALPNFGRNGGVGADPRTALAKAVGEAVERYCSALFDYDELVWSTHRGLAEPATHPESFALYLPHQYADPDLPWRPFTEDTPVAWVRGRSLRSGDPVLVPAAFVHVPYHYRPDRPDTPITQPISTGLACGSSVAEATLSALCEVVERDAFTIMWQGGLSRPVIRPATLPPVIADLVDRYTSVGLRVHLVDIGTGLDCPTVLAVAEGDAPTSPALAVAAAAHPDPVVAARKSLEELAHTRKFAAQVMDYLPPVPVDVAGGHPAVDGQRAHLRYYCPQEAKAYARFAWSAPERVDLTDLAGPAPDQPTAPARPARDQPEAPARPAHDQPPIAASGRHRRPGSPLDALVARVAATGEDIVACDLTTPDIAELGLAVVRVVVPGFHPLHMGHANRCLGGVRLATLPALAGRPDWSPRHDNPHPHPFP